MGFEAWGLELGGRGFGWVPSFVFRVSGIGLRVFQPGRTPQRAATSRQGRLRRTQWATAPDSVSVCAGSEGTADALS